MLGVEGTHYNTPVKKNRSSHPSILAGLVRKDCSVQNTINKLRHHILLRHSSVSFDERNILIRTRPWPNIRSIRRRFRFVQSSASALKILSNVPRSLY